MANPKTKDNPYTLLIFGAVIALIFLILTVFGTDLGSDMFGQLSQRKANQEAAAAPPSYSETLPASLTITPNPAPAHQFVLNFSGCGYSVGTPVYLPLWQGYIQVDQSGCLISDKYTKNSPSPAAGTYEVDAYQDIGKGKKNLRVKVAETTLVVY